MSSPSVHDKKTGGIDLKELKARISSRTAAVYIESPSYLGLLEGRAAEIAAIARAAGAETIMGVDPVSLGVIRPPADLGADIAVGPTQSLGVHMNCGGGVGGFIASRDEERYVRQYNGFLVSITGTSEPGEYGFSLSSSHQTSYGMREEGRDWTGNSVYLWAIANAVYMSLLGPARLPRAGRADPAAGALRGPRPRPHQGGEDPVPPGLLQGIHRQFRRHRQDVSRGSTRRCARRGIFGGKDLSREFPELGQSALYCVTEAQTKEDIDRLAAALKEVIGK